MYRIPQNLASYLLDHSKGFEMLGIDKDPEHPFIQSNVNAIGSINPLFIMGSESKYIVEIESPEFGIEPEIVGCWLYKKSELNSIKDTFEIPQTAIDKNCTNLDTILDISDCVVEIPSPIDRLTCTKIDSLNRLFELEPDIKNCLSEK
jgi:hypothetical protein